MSKKLPPEINNALTALVAFALFGAPASARAESAPVARECREAFRSDTGTERFQGLRAKLEQIPLAQAATIRSELPTRILQTSPVEDSRQYDQRFSEELFFLSREPHKTDAALQAIFDDATSKYAYIRTREDGMVTFTAKASGRIFVVPHFEEAYSHQLGYLPRYETSVVRTNAFLGRIETILESGERDPDLDRYFAFKAMLGEQKRAESEGRLRDFLREQFLDLPRAEIVGSEDLLIAQTSSKGWGKYLRKETRRRGVLYITTIDTQFLKRNVGPDPGSEIKRNEAVHRSLLKLIASRIYPEYLGRRHWTEDFVAHDFAKVLQSRNHTRYIIVHSEPNLDDPDAIISVIGLNRAKFRGIRFFNLGTGRWEERYGAHGSDESDGEGFIAKGSCLECLGRPAHLLGMEHYLGIRVPRDIDIDVILRPGERSFEEARASAKTLFGIDVDPEQPIYSGNGVIFEPVKFFMAKEKRPDESEAELVSAMVESMYPDGDAIIQLKLGTKSGRLFTFNPLRDGKLLYQKRGYSPDTKFESKVKDGTEWHVFSESPKDLLTKFYAGAKVPGRAHDFLAALRAAAESAELAGF